jgi:transcriptional antiterminator
MPISAFGPRLDLLVGSGQVTSEARELAGEFVGRVEREFGVTLTEDNGALMVTHLAMSVTRLLNGEPAPDVPPGLAEELAGYPRETGFVREAAAGLAAGTGHELPEAEVLFLAAHLCALTANLADSANTADPATS